MLPGSINYQDVLPVAVPAIARRRRYYPQNGTTFNHQGSSEIRIELPSTNSMMDPQHSYLEFRIQNASGFAFGADIGGGSIFFDEVSVEQGGRVLARQQAHNRLHAGILSVSQTNENGQLMESISEVQRGANDPGGGPQNQMVPVNGAGALLGTSLSNRRHNANVQINAGESFLVTMPIPTGLFTQEKLLPLPLVSQSAPLTLVLKICDPAEVGVWTGNVAGTGAISFDRVNVVAQMIEVGSDVLQQFKQMQMMGGGQLSIHSTDIEHSQGVLPAGGGVGERIVRVPIRKRSIKSLLFQINSEDFTNAGGVATNKEAMYNLSFGGNANMGSYQLKVGSVVYPPTPIACWGPTGAAVSPLQRGECAMELAKALGTLGFTNPTGRLAGITYGVLNDSAAALALGALADGDNGDGAGNIIGTQTNQVVSACPFGLDLDSFQHQAIEAGVDSETMALETNLILNIEGAGGVGGEDKNVHTYLIYDQHYYFNSDGSITFSN